MYTAVERKIIRIYVRIRPQRRRHVYARLAALVRLSIRAPRKRDRARDSLTTRLSDVRDFYFVHRCLSIIIIIVVIITVTIITVSVAYLLHVHARVY